MLVKFSRNWFGPDGQFYRAKAGPYPLPDQWEKRLPSTATIIEGGAQSPPSSSDDDNDGAEPARRGPGRPRKEG